MKYLFLFTRILVKGLSTLCFKGNSNHKKAEKNPSNHLYKKRNNDRKQKSIDNKKI